MEKFASPIKIDHFLEKHDEQQETNNATTKDAKLLNAYLITVSKQLEQLNKKTETPKQTTKEYPWKPHAIFIGVILILCGIVFFTINQKNKSLKSELNLMFEQHQTSVQTLVAQAIPEKETKKPQLNQRTLIIKKLSEIEKNVSKQNEKLEKQDEMITNITNDAYKAKLKVMYEDKINVLEATLNSLENTQEKTNVASSLLDKVEQKIHKPTNKKQPLTIFEKNKKLLYSNAYSKMGWTYISQGNFKKAIEEYQHALKLNPANGMAYYNIACCYAKLGQTQETLEWLKNGRPYFDKNILETAKHDPDLAELRENPYFNFLLN